MRRFFALLLGLLLCLSAGALAAEENLLENGGFEQISEAGQAAGWQTKAYIDREDMTWFRITDEKAHSGQYSAMIDNIGLNDARYIATVRVEPESLYRLSGYLYVEPMEQSGCGANLALEDVYARTEAFYDTAGEWQYVQWYGETDTDQHEVTLGVRVGGYGGESIGKAYFDDIALEKVDELPEGVIASTWFTLRSPDPAPAQADAPQKNTGLYLLLGAAFALLCALGSWVQRRQRGRELLADHKAHWAIFGALLLAGLTLRLVLAAKVAGYQVDINCFTLWSQRMAKVGPSAFYAEGYFCDYPPGYLYVLWLNGLLMRRWPEESLLIVKLVPILCDMVTAMLLYRFFSRRTSRLTASIAALFYVFNPAVLATGAAWGQVDSVLALLLLLACLAAMDEKWIVAVPLFFVAALTKPQAILMAPIGGMWLIVSLLRRKKGQRKAQLLSLAQGTAIAMAAVTAIVLPFAIGKSGLGWLIDLYKGTLGSYDYATINTANLYYLLGGNWSPLSDMPTRASWTLPFVTGVLLAGMGLKGLYRQNQVRTLRGDLGDARKLTLSIIAIVFGCFYIVQALVQGYTHFMLYGTVMMVLVFCVAVTYVIFMPSGKHLPFAMALALMGVYVLTLKMHERYLFAAIALLLLGAACTRDRRLLWLAVGFSVTTFLNTVIVLENSILFGSAQGHLNSDTMAINIILCVLNLLLCGLAFYIAYQGESEPRESKRRDETYRRDILYPRDAKLHLSWRDFAIMGAAAVVYGVVCLSTLGSAKAPQTAWVACAPEEQVVFELPESTDFHFLYYGGVSYNDFTIAVSEDGESWSEEYPCEMREGLCYRWLYALNGARSGSDGKTTYPDRSSDTKLLLHGRYLRLSAQYAGLNLWEVLARDAQQNVLPLSVVSHTGANSDYREPVDPSLLLDEQDTLEGEPGWYNGTYFDEIYHARTAYEYLHAQNPYEWTHPPLGKLIMALGIAIFGMTPFGWRFGGAFFGVLMLPAMYLLCKQLTKRRDLSAAAMLLMTFDLMHFAQTRIATIDTFPVFFIMLSVMLMARYLQSDFFAVSPGHENERLLSRTYVKTWIPLALSGLMMGLGIASKWIGIYSAVGLAVMFFSCVYRQARMAWVAATLSDDEKLTDEQKRRVVIARDLTGKRIWCTLGACVVFFIVVPAVIYYLSYLPHLAYSGVTGLKESVRKIMSVQESMLSYHGQSNLGMDHPFQSPWYQWPLILKPMWYVRDGYEPAGMGATIMCMGNPVVFYAGALAMAAMLALLWRKYVSLRGDAIRLRQGDGELNPAIIVTAFLAQYLPWVLVPRSMYMYHYFASVPFIILSTVYLLGLIPQERRKLKNGLLWGLVALAAIAFVAFYPYASGAMVSTQWLKAMQWFSHLYY